MPIKKTPGAQASTIKVGNVDGEPCEEFYPPPCCMVIFGASGDLAATKLIPALFRLVRTGLVSKNFFIVGAARTRMSDDAFRDSMREAMRQEGRFDEDAWPEFAKRLFYAPLDYGDKDAFAKIKPMLALRESEFNTKGNRIFYLATPPSVYKDIVDSLAASGLANGRDAWTRIVVEKPYGRDLQSARDLTRTLQNNFDEEQIYRIDHYLGKETVQNILMLRFANAIFEPVWNRRYIDHIQITSAESRGIEKRAGYFEQAGVLRDMFQNHMLQVLSLTAMEPPTIYESRLVSEERVKVLRALRPIPLDDGINDSLVLGQYVSGEVNGRPVDGYTEEEGVAKDSTVPTYAAMKLYIDNWRWQGVPFYLRSGKRLKNRFSQVTIQFRGVPHLMFKETLKGVIGPNALILRIQPDERVQLKFHTKNPGTKVCLRDVVMDFSYAEGYTGIALEAYERMLLDCMLGDKMLFVSSEAMELSWAFLTPVLEKMENGETAPPLNLYRSGTWGPMEAEKFMHGEGRSWSNYG